jgi:hypothetical protein
LHSNFNYSIEIEMGTRVFIGRLPSRATERDIEHFFRGNGRIREVVVKTGFGFVVSLHLSTNRIIFMQSRSSKTHVMPKMPSTNEMVVTFVVTVWSLKCRAVVAVVGAVEIIAEVVVVMAIEMGGIT